jgi:hypothetical protein
MGVMIGFGTGYYLGSMAGRERYEQLNRMIRKVKRSDAFDSATEKAKAVVDLGVERARDLVDSKVGGDGTTPGDPTPDVGVDTHLRTTTNW